VNECTEVTRLLEALNAGDGDARERLIPLVYDELRKLAGGYMSRERPGHTLQPTALVNEAWLKLADQSRVEWKGRAHFFGIAAQAMRRILIDHHRRRSAARRAGRAVTLIDAAETFDDPLDFIILDDALDKLAELDPRAARIVELRFFGGLTVEETAEVLDVSVPTVKRDWRMAKAWLYRRLKPRPGVEEPEGTGPTAGFP
jgi:RNA polymerase sigma factor (TIGR02999 family)